MPFNNNYITLLKDIIALVKEKKLKGEDGAVIKFSTYLDIIQEIGNFNIGDWRQDWRKKVWEFGELFRDLNPSDFLEIVDNKIKNEPSNIEVLEFIKSEIIINFLPKDYCKTLALSLIERYPLNPEFRHNLAHYYGNDNEYLKSVEEYRTALKIEPSNSDYIKSRFGIEYRYLNQLIADNDYQVGKEYVENLFNENPYKGQPHYHNSIVDCKTRFVDHIAFQEKLISLEADFVKKIQTELDSERRRIIEIIAFFSSVVAFILVTVSIGKNFTFLEAIYFIIGLGIILLLFNVSLSVLFSKQNQNIFNDKRFWILIFSLFALIIFMILAMSISNFMSSFN